MYTDVKMGSNANCKKCRDKSNIETNALSAWLIRDKKYVNNILFVGKVARGDILGPIIGKKLEDCTSFGDDAIHNYKWPFWRYSKDIIQNVYGDLQTGLKYISMTNLVKCNNTSTNDSTQNIVRDYCIRKNQFILKEIEILHPTTIIFYTGYFYDDFIDEFIPSFATLKWDVKNRRNKVAVGNKFMPWWERKYLIDSEKVVMNMLRVGHPERKNKKEYVGMVSSWIRKSISEIKS